MLAGGALTSPDFSPGRTWSHTLGQDLDDCARRVYYRVYGSWLGWDSRADKDTRTIYLLKTSDNLATYTGSVVHDAIQKIVQALRSKRAVDSDEVLLERLGEKMRDQILYSESRKWEGVRNPKRATLILREHLVGEDLHSHQVETFIERGRDALKAFLETYMPLLRRLRRNQIVLIDSLDFIEHRGFKLFLVPDLVLKKANGRHVVIDWKTGKMANAEQLEAYAMYLIRYIEREKGAVLDPGDVEAWSVPLLNPENKISLHVEPSHIKRAMARIDRDIDTLSVMHEDGLARNESAFPKTEHVGPCMYCSFAEYCYTRP